MNITRFTAKTLEGAQELGKKTDTTKTTEAICEEKGKLLDALTGLASTNQALIQRTKPLTFDEKLKKALQYGAQEDVAKKLANLDEKQFQRAQELIVLREKVAELRKAEFQNSYRRLFAPKSFTTFAISDILKFVTLKDDRYELAKAMLGKKMEGWRVDSIANLEEKDYQKAIKLFNLNLNDSEITEYCLSDEKVIEKISYLCKNGAQPNFIKSFLELDDTQCEKALQFCRLGVPNYYAIEFGKLDDVCFQRALKAKQMGVHQVYIEKMAFLDDEQFKRAEFLLKKGIGDYLIEDLVKSEEKAYQNFIELLENGTDIITAKNIYKSSEETAKKLQRIKSKPNPMRDLLSSETYTQRLKKASQGKYQKEVMEMLNLETMTFATRKSLLESGLSEEDFFASVKKLSKSTIKNALENPNQYLSDIDIIYTTKVDGKYPKLSGEELQRQQKEMMSFFSCHIGELARAGKYLDTDTINQLMDKRTENFAITLENLHKLSDDNYSLLSKLITRKKVEGKALTAKDKIDLSQIISVFQEGKLDKTILEEAANSERIDVDLIKEKCRDIVFDMAGVTQEQRANIPPERLQFSKDFTYLILKNNGEEFEQTNNNWLDGIATLRNLDKQSMQALVNETKEELTEEPSQEVKEATLKLLTMYENIDKYTDNEVLESTLNLVHAQQKSKKQNSELYTLIRESVLGDFHKFITDTSNIYGQANAKTRKTFEALGLDYEKWLKPDIEDVQLDIGGKKLKIKIWDRNPQEDLFVGNKTTCCTAIGTGSNAGSTPSYLLNTAFNIVEIYDEKGNVVGMSRVFMGEINGEPSLIMDNIELNNSYIKGMSQEELAKIRNGFFNYMNQYSQQITKKPDSQVYFSTKYTNVPKEDLKRNRSETKFLGELAQNSVYINAQEGWVNPEEMNTKAIEWFVVPKSSKN